MNSHTFLEYPPEMKKMGREILKCAFVDRKILRSMWCVIGNKHL